MAPKRKRLPPDTEPRLGEVNPPPEPEVPYTGPMIGELVGNRFGEGEPIRRRGRQPGEERAPEAPEREQPRRKAA